MHQRAGLDLFFDDRRHLASDLFAGNLAALLGEQFLVAALELNGRRIRGINAQHVIHLRPGFLVVATALRRAGQFQPHRRQAGDGLVALGVHA